MRFLTKGSWLSIIPWLLFVGSFLLVTRAIVDGMQNNPLPPDLATYVRATERIQQGDQLYFTPVATQAIWRTIHAIVPVNSIEHPEATALNNIPGPYLYPPTLALWYQRLGLTPVSWIWFGLAAVIGFAMLWLGTLDDGTRGLRLFKASRSWWLLLVLCSVAVLSMIGTGNVESLLLFLTLLADFALVLSTVVDGTDCGIADSAGGVGQTLLCALFCGVRFTRGCNYGQGDKTCFALSHDDGGLHVGRHCPGYLVMGCEPPSTGVCLFGQRLGLSILCVACGGTDAGEYLESHGDAEVSCPRYCGTHSPTIFAAAVGHWLGQHRLDFTWPALTLWVDLCVSASATLRVVPWVGVCLYGNGGAQCNLAIIERMAAWSPLEQHIAIHGIPLDRLYSNRQGFGYGLSQYGQICGRPGLWPRSPGQFCSWRRCEQAAAINLVA
ncbi:MAG: hypothetical protein R2932_01700 [Caldilineaceae bacterium]